MWLDVAVVSFFFFLSSLFIASLPLVAVWITRIPASTGLLYDSVCLGPRGRPYISAAMIFLAVVLLLDPSHMAVLRIVLHILFTTALMLAVAYARDVKHLNRTFKIPALLGLFFLGLALVALDGGLEQDLVFVPATLSFVCVVVAWALWMHSETGKLRFVLLGVAFVHYVQSALILIPPPAQPLPTWITALPVLLFYGPLSIGLLATAYTNFRRS